MTIEKEQLMTRIYAGQKARGGEKRFYEVLNANEHGVSMSNYDPNGDFCGTGPILTWKQFEETRIAEPSELEKIPAGSELGGVISKLR